MRKIALMLMAFGILGPVGAKQWVYNDITSKPINAVVIGDGDNDGTNELYTRSPNNELLKLEYKLGKWEETIIGSSSYDYGKGIAIGDANNDGKNEIYTFFGTKLLEYQWTGTNWEANVIDDNIGEWLYYVVIGDGDNDGLSEIYIGIGTGWYVHEPNGLIYQYKWNGSSWTKTYVGIGVAIGVGDGDNDGTNEVYGLTYGWRYLYQYKFDGTNWNSTHIAAYSYWYVGDLSVEDGDNDGKNEIYITRSEGGAGSMARAWYDGTWHTEDLFNNYASWFVIGDGDNEGTNEIYVSETWFYQHFSYIKYEE